MRREVWGSCRFVLGCWLGLLLFYWWLISKLQAQQMVAAAVVGLVVALSLLALRNAAELHFTVRLGWFKILLLRLPGKVLRDLGLLAAELLRAFRPSHHGTGALQNIPFNVGGQEPESATRRALVVAAVSVAPNTIAICVEPAPGALRVHQLVFQPEKPADREWPL